MFEACKMMSLANVLAAKKQNERMGNLQMIIF